MAAWETAYINDLPDSAFLYVEPGEKDSRGRTTPRAKRHFPYRDAAGKVDLPHLRNALARIPQAEVSPAAKRAALAKARRLLVAAQARRAEVKESAPALSEGGLHESLAGGFPELDGDVFKNCVLIRAGLNAAGTHYYTPEFLESLVSVSQGSLAFLNHPTETERRERPERGLEHLAATVQNVRFDPARGALVGDLYLVGDVPPANTARVLFRNPTVRETAGLSINYPFNIEARFMSQEGKTITVPTKLAGPAGAKPFYDFVTAPGAGGRV